MATNATLLLPVLEYEDMCKRAKEIHADLGHATVGVVLKSLLEKCWHPEIVLAAQQTIILCPQRQLMKKPNPAPPNLKSITPLPPLHRWAIDFTAIHGNKLLVGVKYTTNWVEIRTTTSTRFEDTVPLLEYFCCTFGTPREWISDNAGCFKGAAAQEWHK